MMKNRSEYNKQYWEKHKKEISERRKQYYKEHKEEIDKRNKRWFKKNKDKWNAYQRERRKRLKLDNKNDD